ncbi:TPA: Ger(x)C family spore germination protein [Bacillus cereus]
MKYLYIILSLVLLTGCYDQVYMEDVAITLILGIDLDEDDKLKVYLVNPLFNKEQRRNEEKHTVQSMTIRSARDKFDVVDTALTFGSKTQVILLGKKLLQDKNCIEYLDPFLRDPQNTITTKIVGVNGKVSDIIYYKSKDNKFSADFLNKLIDTANKRNITVKTTFKDLYRQAKEKGITPTISSISKTSENQLKLMGSMLLDSNNKFKINLTPYENKLLTILQHKSSGDFPFTLNLPLNSQKKQWLSFSAQSINTKTYASFNNKFIFNIHINLGVEITEKVPNTTQLYSNSLIEKEIKKKITQDINQLIAKLQKLQIEPIGLGLYARAYEYTEWEKIQNNWSEHFSKSKVKINVNIKIRDKGAMR